MEVVLCQGSERLSGKTGPAPVADPNQQRMAEGLRRRPSSSSSSSSEDEGRAPKSQDKKSDKQARKAAQKEEKRQEKQEKKARKARGENKLPHQLVVTAI